MSIGDMIDAVCGVTPEMRAEWNRKQAELEANGVLLFCACGAKKWDERIPEYGDLDTIEVQCPDCRPAAGPDRRAAGVPRIEENGE